jgi:hypothetical protein
MTGPAREAVPVMDATGGPRDGAMVSVSAAAPGLSLVRPRTVLTGGVVARFAIRPGDRPLVALGEAVVRGSILAERLRDPRTEVVVGPEDGSSAGPGDAWTPPLVRRAIATEPDSGELLFQSGGRWRIGTGDHHEPLEAPFPGVVAEVRPGSVISVRSPGLAIPGFEVIGGPTSGRLEMIAGRNGEVRASEIDVGGAGAILVAGAHIDAEAITRARAVGVRGIVVAALGVKERRDVLASERRGQAAVHGLPPFGILVLDGAVRRPIASPIMATLEHLVGRTVAIVADPPSLVVDDPDITLAIAPADLVRVIAGPLAGAEGRWAGLAGPHRFPGGVVLEAGLVRLSGRPPVAIPLGDLERFV